MIRAPRRRDLWTADRRAVASDVERRRTLLSDEQRAAHLAGVAAKVARRKYSPERCAAVSAGLLRANGPSDVVAHPRRLLHLSGARSTRSRLTRPTRATRQRSGWHWHLILAPDT